ncbi:hypothetical protein C4577_04915 [Candidatus Parcubacteria bacterium]|nr:MAG: hypothetical protein C4577_04915 [Candidatus Parcubacteria bacterium]
MTKIEEAVEDFYGSYHIDPMIVTVGYNKGAKPLKIIVYLHDKNHNYKFPSVFQGFPVEVIYIGRTAPAT